MGSNPTFKRRLKMKKECNLWFSILMHVKKEHFLTETVVATVKITHKQKIAKTLSLKVA